MASIVGYHHLSLTVRDLRTSAPWYERVLGFSIEDEFAREGFRRARLRQPSGVILSLTQHENGAGDVFSEVRTGLDHVAFEVPSAADVEELGRRFEELGVDHSGVKSARAGQGAMITLRDPDHIQLEIFARGV